MTVCPGAVRGSLSSINAVAAPNVTAVPQMTKPEAEVTDANTT